jgi:hypothetical protein
VSHHPICQVQEALNGEGGIAMAARKTTRKKTAARKRGKGLVDTIEKELADLSKAMEKRLAPLRKEIDKAERQAGTEGARLLREARRRLNKVEIKGQSDLEKFLRRSRRDLSKALTGLEQSVRPKRKKAARKKTARKKATRRA